MDHTLSIDTSYSACHDCDLLQRRPVLREGETARCPRCGALLYRRLANSLERALALNLTALALFIVANVFPFMTLKLEGREQENTLFSGVLSLYVEGKWELAALVLLVTILAPLLKLASAIYVLLPLKFNYIPWRMTGVFRWLGKLGPWAMLEVYMLGVLVAVVKLAQLATIEPGIALYAFAALIIVSTAANAVLDPRIVWERVPIRASESGP